MILNQALRTFLAVAGARGPTLFYVLGIAGMIPLAAAVWGLSYYILYLLTGRRRWLAPLTVFYAAYLLFLFWFQVYVGIAGVDLGPWQTLILRERAPTTAMSLVFGVWLAGPILFAIAAFFVLALREADPTRRYRLGLVSGGFLFLFGMILAGYLLGWVNQTWFPLAYQIPALVASMMSVAAYRPPRWVQRRYGIQPVPTGTLRTP